MARKRKLERKMKKKTVKKRERRRARRRIREKKRNDQKKQDSLSDMRMTNLQKRDLFPWEKVPFVPRPSLVPEPFTVWGRKKQDPQKEFYQYVTLKEKEGTVRGKNVAKDEHTRQLVEGGTVSKVNLDAAAELAAKGHVFERGVLSRQPGAHRHATTPATTIQGRTKILMALQTPSWYRF